MHCDFAFYVGATRENTHELAELERLPGACGVKVFMGSSTGSLLVEDDEGVRDVLKAIRRRASFHSEDEYRLRERMHLRVEGDPRSHPVWRDATAALMCTQRLVRLARETGKRVHVLHVTTSEEMEFLADHKDVASVEATPHISRSPRPIATSGSARWRSSIRRCATPRIATASGAGSAQGVIDSIGSDHSPHTREEKAHAYPKTHSGMTGVQTLVPIMLDHVNAGRLSLARFVDLTSAGPARVFGIAAQGPDRGRLRRRPDGGRSQAPRDHHRPLDRLARRLDALRRRDRDRLAGRHLRARPQGDVAGRAGHARRRARRSRSWNRYERCMRYRQFNACLRKIRGIAAL